MLSFTIVPTPAELKQAAAIQRRRQNEETRKKRIFDPKAKISGVDIQDLEEQIKEKKRLAEEEKRLEQAWLEQQERDAKVIELLDRHAQLQRQKITDEIKRYRMCHQRFEDRREFDLNDPNFLKNEVFCRSLEDEDALGIASMRKFEGEDLCKPERLKLQAEQKRAWFLQQSHEKKVAEEERRKAEDEYQKAIVARDERTTELDRLERECRVRIEAALKELNLALAEQMRSRRKEEEMQDYEDTQAHLYNVATSDMMTENAECGISSLGPGRIIPTMYRGLTEEQKAALKQVQLQQAQEKRAQMEEERQKEAEWDALTADLDRAMALKDQEMERKKKLLEAKITQENYLLMQIHKEQQKKQNEEYKNSFPAPEYFDQFGTSAR